MAKRKCILLIPLARNDGLPVEESELRGILNRFLTEFGGSMVVGEVEGGWRSPSGQEYHDRNTQVWVVYADDFIITGTSQELLRDEVRPLVAHFLKERGLELSHEKTSITQVEGGFDFLGQNVRRYRNGKVLLKPSRRTIRTLLSGERVTIRGAGRMSGLPTPRSITSTPCASFASRFAKTFASA